MYNVFIQWNENTSNYRRFDGGLEQIGEPLETVESANRAASDWLFDCMDMNYYWYPFNGAHREEFKGLQFGLNDTTVVIDFNSTEPASVDFGDGVIYVAEVQS